jgi:hypothetical protein
MDHSSRHIIAEMGSTTEQSSATAGEEGIVEYPSHIVDFDGPSDAEKAVNWPSSRKWLNVFVLASMTFVS